MVTAGSVLQLLLGLAVVLAMVLGAAWLARRFGLNAGPTGGAMRLRGGVSLGPRERAVLLEVRDTWLVVGVAPGQVRTLHTLPRPEDEAPAGETPATPAFAQWLRRLQERPRA